MNKNIEITTATVWDDEQVARWASLSSTHARVTSIYGSRQQQVMGHGRSPCDVPKVLDTRIERHALKARNSGLDFLYLLNGRCEHLDIDESDVKDHVIADLDWIVNSVKASGVVIADIRLAHLTRSLYSANKLKIKVSTIAGVRTLKSLQPWLELDIDGVVLHHDAARDFRVLRQIQEYLDRHAPGVIVELLLNESCLHGCVSRNTHYQRLAAARCDYVEGFQQNCNLPKFRDPSLLLSANWIRPEDIQFYCREFGIYRFKIAGREMSGAWLDRVVSAYAIGQYEGNLIDLLTITPPGFELSAADVLYVHNPALAGFVEELAASTETRTAFYRQLAATLWSAGHLRVKDPGGMYQIIDGRPVCTQPGQHHLGLCSLRAVADPEYRAAKGHQAAPV